MYTLIYTLGFIVKDLAHEQTVAVFQLFVKDLILISFNFCTIVSVVSKQRI